MDSDILLTEHIKEFLPNGFHQTDLEGRPIFFLHLGQTKLSQLTSQAEPHVILQYFIKEFETTWRERFDYCQSATKVPLVD
jgi:hypothetical protein